MGETAGDRYKATLELYERMVATIPEVERKGKTMPYTSLNGHMFSFLSKEGIVGLRLPAQAREEFIEEHESQLCEQYGRIMKEYVEVPPALLEDSQMLAKYFEISHQYVGSLKPK